ncbi:MAG: iron-containing alcohol dehydrogenase, partial [Rubrivivax sp.]
ASPIAVDAGDPKRIEIGDDLLPEARVRWPALAATLDPALARWACGDVWSHALEGLLSPLARGDVEAELAALLLELVATPIGNDTRWFDLGARACTLQARASVGLVHGIAHVLEPRLRTTPTLSDLAHHARLCSALLAPVLRRNLALSPKAADKLARHGIDAGAVLARLDELQGGTDFERLKPQVRAAWDQIVRDPCTRTNVVLVRRDSAALWLQETP